MSFDELNNEEKFDIAKLKPGYGIGGADLSSTTDLTAAKMIFCVPDDTHIYVCSMYWIPADLVEHKIIEDKIPYDKWIEQGYMRTCQGNKIDASIVTEWFRELQDEKDIYLWKLGYDAWSAQMWVNQMTDCFGPSIMTYSISSDSKNVNRIYEEDVEQMLFKRPDLLERYRNENRRDRTSARTVIKYLREAGLIKPSEEMQ